MQTPSKPPNCLMTAWQNHEAELRRWMRHRLPSETDADDMLQDLFLRALRQRERFCSILNARAWLFTVARNAMADRLRLKRNEVELPDDLGEGCSPRPERVGFQWGDCRGTKSAT